MLTTDLKSWVFRQRVGLCCDDVLLLLSNNGGSRLLVKDEVEFQIFFDVALGQYKIAAIDREQNKLKHLWNINSEKLEHYSIRAITLVEMQQARDRLRDFLVMQFSEGKVFASLDIVLSIEVSYRGFVEFVHEAVVNPAVASTKKGVPEVIQA
jgi:hypothetical protein